MDRIARIVRFAALLPLIVGTGCYDGADPPAGTVAQLPPATTSIAELRRLYPGKPIRIAEAIVVHGTVTTSDRAGNFYRSFAVEDDGSAVEVLCGTDESHNRYPVGCSVALRLDNTVLGRSRGVLQLGLRPEAFGEGVEPFAAQAVLDGVVVRGVAGEPPAARFLDPTELEESLCGCLVTLAGMRYVAEEQEDAVWAGYRRFENERGGCIYTYTSPYARFADDPLPAGAVALTGMLQFGKRPDGEGYMLKLRDETDCTP